MSYQDRMAIAFSRESGMSVREIAKAIGRSPSTVSRELRRNTDRRVEYAPHRAQVHTEGRRARPQPSKLARDPRLHEYVQAKLKLKWSPEQISNKLVEDHPGEESMRVSHETIYRALYVQTRGTLKRDLVTKLRTGRALRKPQAKGQQDGRGKRPELPLIADRPAEAADRAVAGHWEGDLIVGKDGKSQIGTLVERTTRYCLLLHLPDSKEADAVEAEMVRAVNSLPTLMKTLTWDQGTEMTGAYAGIEIATDLKVYFCDPHSPWQRGSNENTNGLLRQYFPKGTDLSHHSREHLEFVQAELNGRPRKTLNWKSPAEALNELLLNSPNENRVATTP
ncbi:IS30 family transposase [Glaciibacter sp. 2TAF33]|uniref:IS30 family transposase n=1 Tax=Glaciibacter sp. 2TAF33 TaxID=3233015 RepID=UPI003F9114BE